MPRAYSYLRFSTPEQMKGDSFRRQTAAAEDYARRHGLELDDTLDLYDKGISAYRGKNAKTGALRSFLNAVDAGAVPEGSFLLVESLDRISRDQIIEAQALFLQIISSGITLVTLMDEKAYSVATVNQNPTDLIISILTMMRAHEESATKARRLRESWIGKRAKVQEKPLTARAPAWLTLDKVAGRFRVIEDRAKVVRRIYGLALEGKGQESIAVLLNREGVPVFGTAGHWQRSYILKLLTNPAVMGTLIPHTVEYVDGRKVRQPLDPVPGYYPAIVDEATFHRVQIMRAEVSAPLRGRHAHGEVQNLFGGFALCPCCGGSMTRVFKGSKKGGKPRLVCSRAKVGGGCEYRSVSYPQAEEAFLANLPAIVANAPVGEAATALDEELERLDAAISGWSDEAERLVDAVTLTQSVTAMNRLREVETALDEAKARRLDLMERKAEVSGPLLRQKLKALLEAGTTEALDRGRVNLLLRQLFAGVVVNYRDGTLDLKWKHGGATEVPFMWPDVEEDDAVQETEALAEH